MRRIFALGFFDGVHLGHQALLRACRELSRETHSVPGVVSFTNHPDALVFGETPPLINTAEDRLRLLQHYGMESVEALPFDERMMTMPWQEFFRMLTETFGAEGLVCGNDFRFGFKGEGTPEMVQALCRKNGIPCRVVPEQTVHGTRVSSTWIRGLLEAGDMEEAVAFLGHPHLLTGTVVHGKQLGRTLGIPTANLQLSPNLVVPKFGVYACMARVGEGWYPAVTNVGTRPTVNGVGVTVEPWILDYQGDLYDQKITLEFYRFLRPEKKFPDLTALQQEIFRNAEETRAFAGTLNRNEL